MCFFSEHLRKFFRFFFKVTKDDEHLMILNSLLTDFKEFMSRSDCIVQNEHVPLTAFKFQVIYPVEVICPDL